MSPQDTDISTPAARNVTAFDPLAVLDDLLSTVSLARAATGGAVSIAGQDPIGPAAHRLGACIGIPIMANAVAAAAFPPAPGRTRARPRTGPAPGYSRHQPRCLLAADPQLRACPHPLVLDNPFLLTPYRTADGRWVMASGVYPHLAATWCRFLDVPPDGAKVAAAIQRWDAFELEQMANAAGLPACVIRESLEWLAHPQGALLASQPVIGLERIGDAPPRDFGLAQRPFDGIRVLSFTHAVAGPVVGRTLAEHGADVLGATRPNDYEHEFIYAEANAGAAAPTSTSRTQPGRNEQPPCWPMPTSWSATTAAGRWNAVALSHAGAERYPGLVYVSVTCYGSSGPWAQRGGFDMNGSAASGLMTLEGTQAQPRLPVTGMINDYITGYLGAAGAAAALVKRAAE